MLKSKYFPSHRLILKYCQLRLSHLWPEDLTLPSTSHHSLRIRNERGINLGDRLFLLKEIEKNSRFDNSDERTVKKMRRFVQTPRDCHHRTALRKRKPQDSLQRELIFRMSDSFSSRREFNGARRSAL